MIVIYQNENWIATISDDLIPGKTAAIQNESKRLRYSTWCHVSMRSQALKTTIPGALGLVRAARDVFCCFRNGFAAEELGCPAAAAARERAANLTMAAHLQRRNLSEVWTTNAVGQWHWKQAKAAAWFFQFRLGRSICSTFNLHLKPQSLETDPFLKNNGYFQHHDFLMS